MNDEIVDLIVTGGTRRWYDREDLRHEEDMEKQDIHDEMTLITETTDTRYGRTAYGQEHGYGNGIGVTDQGAGFFNMEFFSGRLIRFHFMLSLSI